MRRGFTLVSSGLAGLSEASGPEALAALHPLWERSLLRYGPWIEGQDGLHAENSPDIPHSLIFGPSSSALDLGWRLFRQLPEWGGIVAASQSHGRGRLRREWHSPPGNLYACLKLPEGAAEMGDLLQFFCAFFAAEAVSALGLEPEVKWPNDLMWRNMKLGGILVEERDGRFLAGIGVNLDAGALPCRLREERSPRAVSLDRAGLGAGPLEVLAKLVKYGHCCYESFIAQGSPAPMNAVLERRLAWRGKTVVVHDAGGGEVPFEARILELLPDGALLLEKNGERFELRSGGIALPGR
jgi:BirA family biotin operon repressor/biotin-[acetyl-CoA-carboxylase] ligase